MTDDSLSNMTSDPLDMLPTTSASGVASVVPVSGTSAQQSLTETAPTKTPEPPPLPPTVDEEYLTRIESTLDETELALLLVEAAQQQQTQQRADAADGRAAVVDQTSGQAATEVLLSVVIPVFNERETVREIVRRVQAVDLSALSLDLEILLVDDFSVDGSRRILLEMEAEHDNVRVFLHGYNRGKGAALRTGFEQVQGDLVIIQDADLEYDPNDYPALLEPILSGETDVVYGSRFLGDEIHDPSFLHRLGNRMLTMASNWVTGQRLTDMETCYKVFRREVIADMNLEQNRFGFEPEITAKVSRRGTTICEVPIAYHGRDYAEGKKIGYRDAIFALWCILRYRLRG